jgi:nucleotide-binding universal stress UspA family protein
VNIQKILVPTDCSEQSVFAIEYAVQLSQLTNAEVHVLHVAPRPGDYYPLDTWVFGEDEGPKHRLEDRARSTAKTAFDKFVGALPAKTREEIEPRLELGNALDTIVELAEKESYDLIVMTTKGRTGAKRVLLGSVAERVLRTAPCPVLTLRNP